MENISTIAANLAQKLAQNPRGHYFAPVSARPASPGLGNPDCPICGGVGLVRIHTDDIYSPDFGKLKHCTCIDPWRVYGSRVGLEETEQGKTWSDLNDRENITQAKWAVNETLKVGYGWVYLWGDYGLAKTEILKIAVATAIRDHKLAAYTRMVEIIDDMRGAYDAKNANEESARRLDFWSSAPILCIDEFDRVRATEYVTERRFILMDRRYEDACREKSITIMASNAAPNTIDGYLADRISDGRFKVVRLTGKSMRPFMD
jgi:hypothetical protein